LAPTARWARAKLWNAARVECGKGSARWRKEGRGRGEHLEGAGRLMELDRFIKDVLRWDVGAAMVRVRRHRGCGASARSARLRCERNIVAGAERARDRRGCGASARSSRLRVESEVGAAAVRARGRRCCGASATSATSSRGQLRCERKRVARGWSEVRLQGEERGELRSWSEVRVAQLERGEPSEAR
jgi:hypothetical protein